MNCCEVEEHMDAALDAGSPPELPSEAALAAHLRDCRTCRQQWELLRAAEAALRVPQPVSAPEGLLAGFRERVQREAPAAVVPSAARLLASPPAAPPAEPRAPWWKRLKWLLPAGSLAAAGAAAVLLLVSTRGGPTHQRMAQTTLAAPAMPLFDESAGAPGGGNGPTGPEFRSTLPRPSAGEGSDLRPRPGGTRRALPQLTTPRPREAALPPAGSARAPAARARKRAELQRGKRGLELAFRPGGSAAAVPPSAPAASLGMLPGGGGCFGWASAAPAPATAAVRLQVEAEAIPVRAALLEALRRPVALESFEGELAEAARRLGEAADLEIQVDPKLAATPVRLAPASGPAWKALEAAALQASAVLLPAGDGLALRPAAAEVELRAPAQAPAAPRPTVVGGFALADRLAAASRKTEPARSAGPGRPAGMAGMAGMVAPLAADRRAWPAVWGALPDRGFAAAEPPQIYFRRAPAVSKPRRPPTPRRRSP